MCLIAKVGGLQHFDTREKRDSLFDVHGVKVLDP